MNTSEIDSTVARDNKELSTQTKKLLKRAQVHASTIPGNDPYWRTTQLELMVINFYNLYVNN